jgi:alpha-tubulin suppressor-like RCC1 family protein
MQWRSAWIRSAVLPAIAAILAAACSDSDTTGPRIATLQVVSGDNQPGPIGGLLPQPLIVKVVDQHNSPVSGALVEFEVTSGSGVLTPSSATSDDNGLATTVWRLGPSVGVQTVSAALNGLAPVSFTANATSAPASKLVVQAGDGQTAKVGAALPTDIAVLVTDAFDNPKANVPVSFTVVSGGGVVSAATAVSDPSGIATVAWTLGTTAGVQSVVAGAGAITPLSFTATATPDAPTQFVVVGGDNQVAFPGTVLPDSIALRLTDQYGNGVPGQAISWNLTTTDAGSVSPTSTITNGSGRTAVRWTLGSTGGPKLLVAKFGTIADTVIGAGYITFVSVNAGGQSSCGIDRGGVLYCWGSNNDGQLGIGQGPGGPGPIFAVPQAVTLVGNQTFAHVSGGQYHYCGWTPSNVGYCWGDNNNGQLGIGSNSRSANEPSLINVGLAFASISAGRSHSCGLTTGGRPYCWGSNDRAQLGGNITIDTVAHTVTLVSDNTPREVGSQTDGKFFGVFDFSAIAAGGVHTCAIDFTHQAFCWGLGRDGQLGDGNNFVDQYIPQKVNGGQAFDSITAGFGHACALSSGGSAFCWGVDTEGQLGNGGTTNANTPSAVAGGQFFVAIAAGYAHTCAITAGGDAYCWGRNAEGQLGTGNTAQSSSPQLVLGGLVFKTISAGDYASCGVTIDNVAYCWGDNKFGTIGDGSTTNRVLPSKVRFQP